MCEGGGYKRRSRYSRRCMIMTYPKSPAGSSYDRGVDTVWPLQNRYLKTEHSPSTRPGVQSTVRLHPSSTSPTSSASSASCSADQKRRLDDRPMLKTEDRHEHDGSVRTTVRQRSRCTTTTTFQHRVGLTAWQRCCPPSRSRHYRLLSCAYLRNVCASASMPLPRLQSSGGRRVNSVRRRPPPPPSWAP